MLPQAQHDMAGKRREGHENRKTMPLTRTSALDIIAHGFTGLAHPGSCPDGGRCGRCGRCAAALNLEPAADLKAGPITT